MTLVKDCKAWLEKWEAESPSPTSSDYVRIYFHIGAEQD